MSVTVGELSLVTSIDFSKFDQQFRNINKRVQKLQGSNLTVKTDLSQLHALNDLLDKKQDHLKQTQQYFNNNPLTPLSGTTVNNNTTYNNSSTVSSSGNTRDKKEKKNTQNIKIWQSLESGNKERIAHGKTLKIIAKRVKTTFLKSLTSGFIEGLGQQYSANVFEDAIKQFANFSKNIVDSIVSFTSKVTKGIGKGLGKTVIEFFLNGTKNIGQKGVSNLINNLLEELLSSNITIESIFSDLYKSIDSYIQKLSEINTELGDSRIENFIKNIEKLKKATEEDIDTKGNLIDYFKILSKIINNLKKDIIFVTKIKKEASIKNSANIAKEKSNSISQDSVLTNKDKAIFVTAGFAGEKGNASFDLANKLKEKHPNAVVFGISNPNSDISSKFVNAPIVSAIKALGKILKINVVEDANKDSIQLAAEILAFRESNPTMPIEIVGHSFGGQIVQETLKILEELNVENIKGIGVGSLDFSPFVSPPSNMENITNANDIILLANMLVKKIDQSLVSSVPSNIVLPNIAENDIIAGHHFESYISSLTGSITPYEEPKIPSFLDIFTKKTVHQAMDVLSPALYGLAPVFRARKQVMLPASGALAQEMASTIAVPQNDISIEKAKSITIATGGIDFQEGGVNTFFAANLFEKVLPESLVIPVTNEWSNDKKTLEGSMFRTKNPKEGEEDKPNPMNRLLQVAIEKGYNPDSVKLAAYALAFRKAYPDKPINIVGSSGGGYITEEAIAILEHLKIQNIKGMGFTAPFAGLSNLASPENFTSAVGELDPLFLSMYGTRHTSDPNSYVVRRSVEEFSGFEGTAGLIQPDKAQVNNIIENAGTGHALLQFLADPQTQTVIKSHFGDNIGDIPTEFSGKEGINNLDFYRIVQNESAPIQRTIAAMLGDEKTLKTIEKYNFGGAEGYTFTVPQKTEWERENDFAAMKKTQTKKAKRTTGQTKEFATQYLSFLDELHKVIETFRKTKGENYQDVVEIAKKAQSFFPKVLENIVPNEDLLKQYINYDSVESNLSNDNVIKNIEKIETYINSFNDDLEAITKLFNNSENKTIDILPNLDFLNLIESGLNELVEEHGSRMATEIVKSFRQNIKSTKKQGQNVLLKKAIDHVKKINQNLVESYGAFKDAVKQKDIKKAKFLATAIAKVSPRAIAEIDKILMFLKDAGIPTDISSEANNLQGYKGPIKNRINQDNQIPKKLRELGLSQEEINIILSPEIDLSNFGVGTELLDNAGENIVNGLIQGIDNSLNELENISINLSNVIVDTVEEQLEIQSPSRVFERIGNFITQGLNRGLEETSEIEENTTSFFDRLKNNFKQLLGIFIQGTIFTNLIQGFREIGKAGLELAGNLEALKLSYDSVFKAGGAEHLAKITKQAYANNQNILASRQGYLQLSASLMGTEAADSSFQIFQGVGKYATLLGTNEDAQTRIFTALSQMASKGRVSLEELTGQLAEQLPGALNIAAEAMQMTTKEFIKIVSLGQVSSADFLPKFGALMDSKASADFEKTLNNYNSLLGRLQNQLFLLKEGFGTQLLPVAKFALKTVTKLIDILTKDIESTTSVIMALGVSMAALSLTKLVTDTNKLFQALFNKNAFETLHKIFTKITTGLTGTSAGFKVLLLDMGKYLLTMGLIAGATYVVYNLVSGISNIAKAWKNANKEADNYFNKLQEWETKNKNKNNPPEKREIKPESDNAFFNTVDWIKSTTIGKVLTFNPYKWVGQKTGLIGKDKTWGDIAQEEANIQASNLAISSDKNLSVLTKNIFNNKALAEFSKQNAKLRDEISNRAFTIEGLKLISTSDPKEIKSINDKIAELTKENKDASKNLIELQNSFVMNGMKGIDDYIESLKKEQQLIEEDEKKGRIISQSVKDNLNQRMKAAEQAKKMFTEALNAEQKELVNVQNQLIRINSLFEELGQEITIRVSLAKTDIINQEIQRIIGSTQSQFEQAIVSQQEAYARLTTQQNKLTQLNDLLTKIPVDTQTAIQTAINQIGKPLEEITLPEIEVLLQSQGIQEAPEQIQQTLELMKQLKQANVDVATAQEQAVSAQLQAMQSEIALRTYNLSLMQLEIDRHKENDLQLNNIKASLERIKALTNGGNMTLVDLEATKANIESLRKSISDRQIFIQDILSGKVQGLNPEATIGDVGKDIVDAVNNSTKNIVEAINNQKPSNTSTSNLTPPAEEKPPVPPAQNKNKEAETNDKNKKVGSQETAVKAAQNQTLALINKMKSTTINGVKTNPFSDENWNAVQRKYKSALEAEFKKANLPLPTNIPDFPNYPIEAKPTNNKEKQPTTINKKESNNKKKQTKVTLPDTSSSKIGKGRIPQKSSIATTNSDIAKNIVDANKPVVNATNQSADKIVAAINNTETPKVSQPKLDNKKYSDFSKLDKWNVPTKSVSTPKVSNWQESFNKQPYKLINSQPNVTQPKFNTWQDRPNLPNPKVTTPKLDNKKYSDFSKLDKWNVPTKSVTNPKVTTPKVTQPKFGETNGFYKATFDPRNTKIELYRGWDKENQAFQNTNASLFTSGPMFDLWTGNPGQDFNIMADIIQNGKLIQKSKNKAAAAERAYISINKKGKVNFGFGGVDKINRQEIETFIGGLHSLYNDEVATPKEYKGGYHSSLKQKTKFEIPRHRVVFGKNKDNQIIILRTKVPMTPDQVKKYAKDMGLTAAYLPDHGTKSRYIVPQKQKDPMQQKGHVPYMLQWSNKTQPSKITPSMATTSELFSDKELQVLFGSDRPNINIKELEAGRFGQYNWDTKAIEFNKEFNPLDGFSLDEVEIALHEYRHYQQDNQKDFKLDLDKTGLSEDEIKMLGKYASWSVNSIDEIRKNNGEKLLTKKERSYYYDLEFDAYKYAYQNKNKKYQEIQALMNVPSATLSPATNMNVEIDKDTASLIQKQIKDTLGEKALQDVLTGKGLGTGDINKLLAVDNLAPETKAVAEALQKNNEYTQQLLDDTLNRITAENALLVYKLKLLNAEITRQKENATQLNQLQLAKTKQIVFTQGGDELKADLANLKQELKTEIKAKDMAIAQSKVLINTKTNKNDPENKGFFTQIKNTLGERVLQSVMRQGVAALLPGDVTKLGMIDNALPQTQALVEQAQIYNQSNLTAEQKKLEIVQKELELAKRKYAIELSIIRALRTNADYLTNNKLNRSQITLNEKFRQGSMTERQLMLQQTNLEIANLKTKFETLQEVLDSSIKNINKFPDATLKQVEEAIGKSLKPITTNTQKALADNTIGTGDIDVARQKLEPFINTNPALQSTIDSLQEILTTKTDFISTYKDWSDRQVQQVKELSANTLLTDLLTWQKSFYESLRVLRNTVIQMRYTLENLKLDIASTKLESNLFDSIKPGSSNKARDILTTFNQREQELIKFKQQENDIKSKQETLFTQEYDIQTAEQLLDLAQKFNAQISPMNNQGLYATDEEQTRAIEKQYLEKARQEGREPNTEELNAILQQYEKHRQLWKAQAAIATSSNDPRQLLQFLNTPGWQQNFSLESLNELDLIDLGAIQEKIKLGREHAKQIKEQIQLEKQALSANRELSQKKYVDGLARLNIDLEKENVALKRNIEDSQLKINDYMNQSYSLDLDLSAYEDLIKNINSSKNAALSEQRAFDDLMREKKEEADNIIQAIAKAQQKLSSTKDPIERQEITKTISELQKKLTLLKTILGEDLSGATSDLAKSWQNAINIMSKKAPLQTAVKGLRDIYKSLKDIYKANQDILFSKQSEFAFGDIAKEIVSIQQTQIELDLTYNTPDFKQQLSQDIRSDIAKINKILNNPDLQDALNANNGLARQNLERILNLYGLTPEDQEKYINNLVSEIQNYSKAIQDRRIATVNQNLNYLQQTGFGLLESQKTAMDLLAASQREPRYNIEILNQRIKKLAIEEEYYNNQIKTQQQILTLQELYNKGLAKNNDGSVMNESDLNKALDTLKQYPDAIRAIKLDQLAMDAKWVAKEITTMVESGFSNIFYDMFKFEETGAELRRQLKEAEDAASSDSIERDNKRIAELKRKLNNLFLVHLVDLLKKIGANILEQIGQMASKELSSIVFKGIFKVLGLTPKQSDEAKQAETFIKNLYQPMMEGLQQASDYVIANTTDLANSLQALNTAVKEATNSFSTVPQNIPQSKSEQYQVNESLNTPNTTNTNSNRTANQVTRQLNKPNRDILLNNSNVQQQPQTIAPQNKNKDNIVNVLNENINPLTQSNVLQAELGKIVGEVNGRNVTISDLTTPGEKEYGILPSEEKIQERIKIEEDYINNSLTKLPEQMLNKKTGEILPFTTFNYAKVWNESEDWRLQYKEDLIPPTNTYEINKTLLPVIDKNTIIGFITADNIQVPVKVEDLMSGDERKQYTGLPEELVTQRFQAELNRTQSVIYKNQDTEEFKPATSYNEQVLPGLRSKVNTTNYFSDNGPIALPAILWRKSNPDTMSDKITPTDNFTTQMPKQNLEDIVATIQVRGLKQDFPIKLKDLQNTPDEILTKDIIQERLNDYHFNPANRQMFGEYPNNVDYKQTFYRNTQSGEILPATQPNKEKLALNQAQSFNSFAQNDPKLQTIITKYKQQPWQQYSYPSGNVSINPNTEILDKYSPRLNYENKKKDYLFVSPTPNSNSNNSINQPTIPNLNLDNPQKAIITPTTILPDSQINKTVNIQSNANNANRTANSIPRTDLPLATSPEKLPPVPQVQKIVPDTQNIQPQVSISNNLPTGTINAASDYTEKVAELKRLAINNQPLPVDLNIAELTKYLYPDLASLSNEKVEELLRKHTGVLEEMVAIAKNVLLALGAAGRIETFSDPQQGRVNQFIRDTGLGNNGEGGQVIDLGQGDLTQVANKNYQQYDKQKAIFDESMKHLSEPTQETQSNTQAIKDYSQQTQNNTQYMIAGLQNIAGLLGNSIASSSQGGIGSVLLGIAGSAASSALSSGISSLFNASNTGVVTNKKTQANGAIGIAYKGGEIGDLPTMFNGGPVDSNSVQNLANGGKVSGMNLVEAVNKAVKRERAAGGNPRLVVASKGEEILSTKKGDAQFFRMLKESGQWNQLKKGEIPTYNNGGSIGTSYISPQRNIITNNKSGNTNSVNINVYAQDANSFRRSESQIQKNMQRQLNRSRQRNG